MRRGRSFARERFRTRRLSWRQPNVILPGGREIAEDRANLRRGRHGLVLERWRSARSEARPLGAWRLLFHADAQNVLAARPRRKREGHGCETLSLLEEVADGLQLAKGEGDFEQCRC